MHLEMLAIMKETALKSGRVLEMRQPTAERVETDSKDFLTRQDIESEELITDALHRTCPDIPIYSEESGGEENIVGRLFVVDPLDGTINYFTQDQAWGVSIGLVEDGKPTAGVIFLPKFNALFCAYGHGAVRILGPERDCRVSGTPASSLAQARVWTDHVKGNPTIVKDVFGILTDNTTYPRVPLCATVAMMALASGRIDGFVHPAPEPEDVAAAITIVEAAGGTVTGLDGEPYPIFSRDVMVATNGKIHVKLLDILNHNLNPLNP